MGQAKPLYLTLLTLVQRDRHVAIGVASFGIANLLLEGGRTSHLVFKILITIGRDSMCLILVQSDFAELFPEAKLIVWDEALTQH
jgi:ATP-dependent DNA helicase PIF1